MSPGLISSGTWAGIVTVFGIQNTYIPQEDVNPGSLLEAKIAKCLTIRKI